MHELPLLKDFYDKSIVPVGIQDKARLVMEHRSEGGVYEAVTLWLIALIWYENNEKSGWKTSIYPICPDRPFWTLNPYYETNDLYSLDTALQMSRILEAHSERDLLTSQSFRHELELLAGSTVKPSW